MKTIHNLLLICAVILAVGCKKDSGGSITLSEQTLQVAKIGDLKEVTLTASGPWRAEIAAEGAGWLTVDPTTSGGGDHKITVKSGVLAENESASATVKFILIDGTGSATLTVTRGDVTIGRKSDSLALVALYNSTSGAKKWKIKWTLTKPMREWYGITLGEVGGEMRVLRVLLQENGLMGTLPEAMQYLTELTHFSCEVPGEEVGVPPATYYLEGEFPAFFTKLSKLEVFNIGNNRFTGSIPAEMFELKNLQLFAVHANRLTGSIPENIGNATNLDVVYMQKNQLTGPIPASINKLVNLTMLQVGQNELSGALPDFSPMKKLAALDLSRNAKYKKVEEKMEDTQTVSHLEYVSGGFADTPVSFTDMPELNVVWLSESNIKSCPEFKITPKLRQLLLQDNPSMKTIHPSVFEQDSMLHLYISNTGITELPEVNKMKELIFFVSEFNQLKTLPESFANMVLLEELMLGNNQIETLPDFWSAFKSIRHVRIGYNKLKVLPPSFWTMNGLYSIFLSCNDIEGELPEFGPSWRNVFGINLNCNKFSGSINSLATLVSAQDLQGSFNNFSGDISPNFKNLRSLDVFAFDENELTGTIPGELGAIANMQFLHLNNNRLTGAIPAELEKNTRWCSWDPALNILPQRDGVTLTTTKVCK